MQISVATREPGPVDNACRVVGVHSGGALKGAARTIDRAADGAIGRTLARGDFAAGVGETLVLHEVAGARAERVLLVGLGAREPMTRERWARIADGAAGALLATGTRHASSDLAALVADGTLDAAWLAARLARAVAAGAYRFDGHPREKPPVVPPLERLTLVVPKGEREAAERDVERAAATAAGMDEARRLADLAPNLCTPAYLVERARALAEQFDGLECEVLDEAEMASLGMGALLSVARGSRQPAYLVRLRYRGATRRRGGPIALVGKGVTFDTGGISIKPSASMDEMKYDMCGAAAVFGAIVACCRLSLPIDVDGVIAAVENMPGGDASRPGDVVSALGGRTIEILNTDAEGRLALADALAWVERFEPRAVIDVATLTGACVVALGDVASGLFGNSETLVDALRAAGDQATDPAWELPLLPAYQRQLDSNFADVANIGGKGAGAVTAACFLSRFAAGYDWAHLDIAGTAWRGGKEKGASGRPVPLLMEYLFGELPR